MAENIIMPRSHRGLRIAFEGCGHGELHSIYGAVEESAKAKGWDGVDLVIIGGDFQAVRNSYDMACMSVPQKYKQIGDFHEYYSGQRVAPYLTVFIGGNHEASNHLFELYYGGWVAPNIYYMGAANVIRCGPLRIAGFSGIWKPYDYHKPHYERLPYNRDDIQSIYHVREIDIRKLLQLRTQVDLCLSHDWPKKIEYAGDYETLFTIKRGFREDSQSGKLGSKAAKDVLDRLRPRYWFSAHLHVKFVATLIHSAHTQTKQREYSTRSSPGSADNMDGIGSGKRKLSSDSNQSKPPSKAALSAWNNFYEIAQRQEKTEFLTYQESMKTMTQSNSVLLEDPKVTWRKVDVSRDTIQRQVTKVERTQGVQSFTPIDTKHVAVNNDDEIVLDLESESDDCANSVRDAGSTVESSVGEKTDIDVVHQLQGTVRESFSNVDGNVDNDASFDKGVSAESQVDTECDNKYDMQKIKDLEIQSVLPPLEQEVPETLKVQLPTSFNQPQSIIPKIPEDIKNDVTEFLALDKCLPGKHFLQLVEYEAISDQDVQFNRPFHLQYDQEWLAITRAFADDLVLGDADAILPSFKGVTYYLQKIKEQEDWVQEHVADMTVPKNFARTAPIYEPEVPITTRDMPIEYTNPQTQQFCDMLNIPNKFFLTDEEKQQRIATGPRPEALRNFANNHHRPRGQNQQGGYRGWHGPRDNRRGGHRDGRRGGHRGSFRDQPGYA